MAKPRATKPVFLLTHSRSCSTAIERVFWTNPRIKCFHEEFGAAFYFGPERISDNWKHWKDDKIANSDQSHKTWRSVLEEFLKAKHEEPEKFVFIKDMSYHIIPPADSGVSEIPSLRDWNDGAAEIRQNPTWLPTLTLHEFQFAFLIRSPWLAVPSLYRLHVPPRVYETQLHSFKPAEIGYREIRVLIEYLYPQTAADKDNSSDDAQEAAEALDADTTASSPILIDASDVLTCPEETLGQFCKQVGLPFDVSMLSWEPHDAEMEKAMDKFRAYHHDVISSSGLRKQTQDEEERDQTRSERQSLQRGYQQDALGMEMTEEEYVSEWTSRYGDEAAGKILAAVYLCKDDYVWLRRFAIRPDINV